MPGGGKKAKKAQQREKRDGRILAEFRRAILGIAEAKTNRDFYRWYWYYEGLRNGVMLMEPHGKWQKKINGVYEELVEEGLIPDPDVTCSRKKGD